MSLSQVFDLLSAWGSRTEEKAGERIQAAYGANFARLAQLKAKWDPQNLFRMNKNIAPGT